LQGPAKLVDLPAEELAKEAELIVAKAAEEGVVVRVLGACAFYIHAKHSPEALAIYESAGRLGPGASGIFTDLDLAAYSKQRKKVVELFEEKLKFSYNPVLKALFGYKRLVYRHPQGLYDVDVFFDKLEFNHDVVFGSEPGKGRLDLDYPTIPLADLLLEKLQITKIERKDLVDVVVLLAAHDVCDSGSASKKECIDAAYVASVLSDDWGFWYDATRNLEKVAAFAEELASSGLVDRKLASLVVGRARKLLEAVEAWPKSKKWLKRAKEGTSKPWYRDVEELER